MQVGSLVELVNDFTPKNYAAGAKFGVTFPKKNKIYTVREVGKLIPLFENEIFIRLVEIVNKPVYSRKRGYALEVAFRMEYFRELLPPQEINLEEIIFETA